MKMNRSSVVVEYRLVSGFEEVRRKLLTEEFADRLDRPLAFWALPTDRSSPIALMGKTLRELFSMPFEQLFATPGIGQKKINCLIELLRRAAMLIRPVRSRPSPATRRLSLSTAITLMHPKFPKRCGCSGNRRSVTADWVAKPWVAWRRRCNVCRA